MARAVEEHVEGILERGEGAAAIADGSSCTPAVCTTANLGSTAAATRNGGMLLWKGGCACGAGQHDALNSTLPDTGVCAESTAPWCCG